MTHPSKRKGSTFERQLVNQARESGLDAQRAYASNGEALGEHAEVDLMVESKRIQAKRRKSIATFLHPSEHVDAVAVRQDRGETLIIMTWWEYLDLLKEAGCVANRNPNCTPDRVADPGQRDPECPS